MKKIYVYPKLSKRQKLVNSMRKLAFKKPKFYDDIQSAFDSLPNEPHKPNTVGGSIYITRGDYSPSFKTVNLIGNASSFTKAGLIIDKNNVLVEISLGATIHTAGTVNSTVFCISGKNVELHGGRITDGYCGVLLTEDSDLVTLRKMHVQGGAGKSLKYPIYGAVKLGNTILIDNNFLADTVDDGALILINGRNHTDSYIITRNTLGQDDGLGRFCKAIDIYGSTDGTPLNHIVIKENHFYGDFYTLKDSYTLDQLKHDHVAIHVHGRVKTEIRDNHIENFATACYVTDEEDSPTDTIEYTGNKIYINGFDLLINTNYGYEDVDTTSYRELDAPLEGPEIVYSNVIVGVPVAGGKVVYSENGKGMLIWFGIPNWRDMFATNQANMYIVMPLVMRIHGEGVALNQINRQWMTWQQKQKFDDMVLPLAQPPVPESANISWEEGVSQIKVMGNVQLYKVRLGTSGVCVHIGATPVPPIDGELYYVGQKLFLYDGTNWQFIPTSSDLTTYAINVNMWIGGNLSMTGGLGTNGTIVGGSTIKAAGGYLSSDDSVGATANVDTDVTKTLMFKDGLFIGAW